MAGRGQGCRWGVVGGLVPWYRVAFSGTQIARSRTMATPRHGNENGWRAVADWQGGLSEHEKQTPHREVRVNWRCLIPCSRDGDQTTSEVSGSTGVDEITSLLQRDRQPVTAPGPPDSHPLLTPSSSLAFCRNAPHRGRYLLICSLFLLLVPTCLPLAAEGPPRRETIRRGRPLF